MLGLIVVALAVLYFLFGVAAWVFHLSVAAFGFGMLVGGALLMGFLIFYVVREYLGGK